MQEDAQHPARRVTVAVRVDAEFDGAVAPGRQTGDQRCGLGSQGLLVLLTQWHKLFRVDQHIMRRVVVVTVVANAEWW